ncbi:MAG: DNA repair protein RadC [Pseudomonadota bacterium]
MGINHWPKSDRPREKLLKNGAASLTDSELLAIFLRTGIRGSSAVDLARTMLEQAGDLRSLLDIESEQLKKYRGLGIAKWSQLHAAIELGRRYLASQLKSQISIQSTETAQNFLISQLRHLRQEVFACMFLTTKHQLIVYEEMFQGTIDSAAVYPREIVKRALDLHAAAVILAHNHPSGNSEPSMADRAITHTIQSALATVDIRVLDHIVIGETICSFADRGWL